MLGKCSAEEMNAVTVLVQRASEILWPGPFHFLEEETEETWEGQVAWGVLSPTVIPRGVQHTVFFFCLLILF